MSGYFTGFSEGDIDRLINKINPVVKQLSTDSQRVPKIRNNNSFPRRHLIAIRPSKAKKISNDVIQPLEIIKPQETLPAVDILEDKKEHKHEMVLPTRKIDLDEFQKRQKLIEEQNNKRKELLAHALAIKTKQTYREAQKLNAIKDEFKKLDELLSNDVKILRKEIELASFDYTEAQKKYLKVEKEFVDAKESLYQKLERKEMLTEHLCTVIEKNEERKATKLNELLHKLNISDEFGSPNICSQEPVEASKQDDSTIDNNNEEEL